MTGIWLVLWRVPGSREMVAESSDGLVPGVADGEEPPPCGFQLALWKEFPGGNARGLS